MCHGLCQEENDAGHKKLFKFNRKKHFLHCALKLSFDLEIAMTFDITAQLVIEIRCINIYIFTILPAALLVNAVSGSSKIE